jgi:hypothetical protein
MIDGHEINKYINMQVLTDATKVDGLEVNKGKTW